MSIFRSVGVALAAAIAAALTVGPAIGQTSIWFSLDGKFEGPSAPLLVAIDRGYFQAEGLGVAIDTADNFQDPIKRLAPGGYDMALGDLSTLIRFRDANPASAIKAVFIVTNRPAFAIVSRRSRGVEKPKDLEGKILGAPAADAAFTQWPIFAQANGIDAAKVKIERIGIPVREPMLQNGQVDAVTGLSYSSYVNLKTMGVPIDDLVLMLMADYGVNLYGNAIMVSAKFAAEKPEAVKGFLRALLKGMKDTVKDPAVAIESVLKRNDAVRRSTELERLRMAIRDNIVTPEVRANGYGSADPDRLAKSIEQMAQSNEIKNKPKPVDVFDASFLPAAGDRRVN